MLPDGNPKRTLFSCAFSVLFRRAALVAAPTATSRGHNEKYPEKRYEKSLHFAEQNYENRRAERREGVQGRTVRDAPHDYAVRLPAKCVLLRLLSGIIIMRELQKVKKINLVSTKNNRVNHSAHVDFFHTAMYNKD